MIRIAEEADVPAILEIYAPFITNTAITFETDVPSLSELVRKMKAIKEQAPFLVYEHKGEVLGYAFADVFCKKQAYRWTRELSVYIREDAKTKKCGTGLYTSLIELMRCQNYRVALAGITLPNIPSVNFHERLGFYPVGIFDNIGFKLGKNYRVGWWQLMLQELNEPTKEIISLQEVLQTKQGQSAFKRGEARVLI